MCAGPTAEELASSAVATGSALASASSASLLDARGDATSSSSSVSSSSVSSPAEEGPSLLLRFASSSPSVEHLFEVLGPWGGAGGTCARFAAILSSFSFCFC